jgi:RNA polymerase sigma-70 factor (ECF subfamily)
MIQTLWPKVREGCGEGADARQARDELLVRYHDAVREYFRRQFPNNPHAADDLYSNFALRLLVSDQLIKKADPTKGRFRDYLKRALRNMVIDYYNQLHQRKEGPLPEDPPEPEVPFLPVWQSELLEQAWKAFGVMKAKKFPSYYTVLRFHSDHPELKGPQLVERFNAQYGTRFKDFNLRKLLQRARDVFATFLLAEVERSLENPTEDTLKKELIDLQLLKYCERALRKRQVASL